LSDGAATVEVNELEFTSPTITQHARSN